MVDLPVDNFFRWDATDTPFGSIRDATDTCVSRKRDATDTCPDRVIHRPIAIPDLYGMRLAVVGSRVDRQQPFDHVNRVACKFENDSSNKGRQAGFASTDIPTR